MTRVLVVLPNWFGETLFATPFLRALRHGLPEAWISTLGWPQCREILQHNPDLNAHIDLDERHAHRGWLGKLDLSRQLRGERFDAAAILRKSLSRTLLTSMAGVPQRIGFDEPKAGWLLTHRVARPAVAIHKAASYLPLLAPLGIEPPRQPGTCTYVVSEAERRAAHERFGAASHDRRPLVILHPGANWPHKRWAPARFAALGDELVERQGARIAVTGAPEDAATALAIAGAMRGPCTVLAGTTTVRELAACLEEAALVVANDTGVLHLAAALGRPVVALYGPTSPAITGPLGGPRGTIVLHHGDSCPQIPCYRPDDPPHPGMDRITVEEAYRAAISLLEMPNG